jgi:hypothetical protein
MTNQALTLELKLDASQLIALLEAIKSHEARLRALEEAIGTESPARPKTCQAARAKRHRDSAR